MLYALMDYEFGTLAGEKLTVAEAYSSIALLQLVEPMAVFSE